MYLKEEKMGNATVWVIGEESHARQSVRNKWREIFLEKVKGSYLRRMKKENGKWRSFKLKSPKELETSGKPNSPTRKNINSINQNMPRATAHEAPFLI